MEGMSLFLALLLAQDPVERQIERWRSDDPAVRTRATGEILARWKEWKEGDLAALDRAAGDPDTEVAAQAREAAARVRLRRRLGETLLSGVAGIDAALYKGSDDERLRVLEAVTSLWRGKKVSGGEASAAMEAGSARPWETRGKEALSFAYDEDTPSAELILVCLLKSRDPDVRGRAAAGLGEGRYRKHAKAVLGLLRDPEPLVGTFAAMALERMQARELAGEVAEALTDPRPGVRQAALGCLSKIGSKDHASRIAPLLEDTEPGVRAAALGALGGIRAVEHAERVAGHLKDRDPECRRTAALALASMGAKDQAGKIAARLREEEDRVARWDAVRALGILKAGKYARDLVPLLKDGGGRFPASEALGEMGLKEFAPDLVPLLEDNEPGVRWRAVVALQKMGAWEQGGAIAGALQDTDPQVRRSAMQALSGLGAVEQAGKTLLLLRDPDAVLRGQIQAHLGGFVPAAELERAAEEFLADPDADVRANFAHLLGASGSRKSAPRLVPLLRDGDRDVRAQAAQALGEMGSPEHARALLPLFSEEDEYLRQVAALAAGRLAAQRPPADGVVEALEKLERDPQESVRSAAGCALARLGRKDGAAQRELLRTASFQAAEALAWVHEPEAWRRLEREVELSDRVTTVRELEEAFRKAGVPVKVEGDLVLRRFGPPGWKTSARRAGLILLWAFVLPGDPLRLVDEKTALEYWQKRLDGK